MRIKINKARRRSQNAVPDTVQPHEEGTKKHRSLNGIIINVTTNLIFVFFHGIVAKQNVKGKPNTLNCFLKFKQEESLKKILARS
jgi:hypothetical protein